MKIDLGKRIKFFRKRIGMSQLELEAAIDSSAGAISRIENNQVNPTKETILNIAKILALSNVEIDYLIGQTALPATEREIESAKEESKEFLITRNRFGYLLDERWKYHLFSKGFIEILSMEPFEIEYLLGKTTVQSLVEKESPIPKRLDVEYYDQLLESYLHSYYSWMSHMDDDPTYKDSVKSIIKNSRSNKIWNKIKSKKFTPEESRFVHFNVFGKKFALHYSGLPLAINNRFYLVEYYTENKLTDLLSKYT